MRNASKDIPGSEQLPLLYLKKIEQTMLILAYRECNLLEQEPLTKDEINHVLNGLLEQAAEYGLDSIAVGKAWLFYFSLYMGKQVSLDQLMKSGESINLPSLN